MVIVEKIEDEPFKNCPACSRKTPISECKQIISRSSGKTTTSWRCIVCYEIRNKKKKDLARR